MITHVIRLLTLPSAIATRMLLAWANRFPRERGRYYWAMAAMIACTVQGAAAVETMHSEVKLAETGILAPVVKLARKASHLIYHQYAYFEVRYEGKVHKLKNSVEIDQFRKQMNTPPVPPTVAPEVG